MNELKINLDKLIGRTIVAVEEKTDAAILTPTVVVTSGIRRDGSSTIIIYVSND